MNTERKKIVTLLKEYNEGKLNSGQTRELFRLLEDNSFDDLFEEAGHRVPASSERYPFKSRLLRNNSDITIEQFEYLCIALSEGDLTPEQEEDVKSMAASDRIRMETLCFYRNLRVVPDETVYPRKNRLKRLSVAGKVVRAGYAALAVAASAAVLIIALRFNPGPEVKIAGEEYRNVVIEAENPVSPSEVPVASSYRAPETGGGITLAAAVQPTVLDESPDVLQRIVYAPVSGKPMTVKVAGELQPAMLAQMHPAKAGEYHGLLTLKDHLAIAFREKLLGEKVPDASPLKGYEIASAGITGINMLLGWEMNLAVGSREEGETNSIEFNSKLINFQTPLRISDNPR